MSTIDPAAAGPTAVASTAAGTPAHGYPAGFDIPYPESWNRGLLFYRWLLALPAAFVVMFYTIGAVFMYMVAAFTILFTGKYPESSFQYFQRYLRLWVRYSAFRLKLTDLPSPTNGDPDPSYPAQVTVPQQIPEISRFRPLYIALLAFPTALRLVFVVMAAGIVSVIAWWAILFTGSYPEELFRYQKNRIRLGLRLRAFQWMMTTKSPGQVEE
jgi:ABC-type sugar transport system permease subunit